MKQSINDCFFKPILENGKENTKIKTPSKSFSFSQFSDGLSQICRPLFDFLEIHLFSIRRFYKNGKHLYLCSDAAWVEHYFKEKYYNHGQFENFLGCGERAYQLWREIPKEDHHYLNLLQDGRENFNIDNGFMLIKNYELYVDVYSLATIKSNKNANNFYLSNLEPIEKFIKYFLIKSNPIINNIEKEKIFNLPCTNRNWQENDLKNHKDNIQKFYKQIELKKFYCPLSLSRREEECLFYLTRGKTAKHIARLLGINHRTVECHVLHIKSKLKCHTKDQLIEKAFESGFVHFTPNSLTMLPKNREENINESYSRKN